MRTKASNYPVDQVFVDADDGGVVAVLVSTSEPRRAFLWGVDAGGTLRWGREGRELFSGAPATVALDVSDESIFVAWAEVDASIDLHVRRLDPSGAAAWTAESPALALRTLRSDDFFRMYVVADGVGGAFVVVSAYDFSGVQHFGPDGDPSYGIRHTRCSPMGSGIPQAYVNLHTGRVIAEVR